MTVITSPQDEASAPRRTVASVSPAMHVLATIGVMLVVAFAGMLCAAFDSVSPFIKAFGDNHGTVGALAALSCTASMIWRRSHPWHMFGINLIAAALFPIGPAGTLIMLTWVIPIANRLQTACAILGAAFVTTAALWQDWIRPTEHTIFSNRNPVTDDLSMLPGYGYVLVGAGLLVLAVSAGVVRRYRIKVAATEAQIRDSERVASSLRGEINRQEEREQIARDMHDTIAHELSVIALHASALEVAAPDDETREGVKAVRRSANRGLSELRSIIGNLRNGDDSKYRGPRSSINGLTNIVDAARRAGVRIQDVIEVRSAENLAATVSNGIYRIVQESVTNAIRHAPDSPITVSVIGGPHEGIKVIVASWLADKSEPSQGAGSGIAGMQERARALGGDLMTNVENGMWVVRANLPWRAIEDGGQ